MFQFRSAAALRAHYAAVHARLWPAAKIATKPEPQPQPQPQPTPKAAGFESHSAVNALTQEFSVRYAADDDNAAAIREILHAVATHYGVTVGDIKSRRRIRTIGLPRHVAYYLCKTLTGSSLLQIGQHVGGKDHTSVLHGVRTIAARLETDAQLAVDIRAICTFVRRAQECARAGASPQSLVSPSPVKIVRGES